jgi:hypothetical protein
MNNKEAIKEMKGMLFTGKDKQVVFSVDEMMMFVKDLSHVVKVSSDGQIFILTNKAKFHMAKRIELMLFTKAISHIIDARVSKKISFEDLSTTFSHSSANGESPYYVGIWERYIKRNKYHLVIEDGKIGLKETSIKYYHTLLFPKK